ncbi:MAG TPA: cell division protein FtsK, partial [Glaciihabitans sp.]|nr:cell division protein FtsK [Glaciihabitans sp.]
MAESTKSNSRARTSASRSRTAPTKKLPTTPTRATKKQPAPEPQHKPGLLTVAWMSLAHTTGAAFRVFGFETLAKEERRDGVPFLIFLLAVAGVIVEWFNPLDPVALALDAYTFGGIIGRVAFALPVIMFVFAGWLFRHPASVHDNTRIGIGVGIMIATIAALCHMYGAQPQPDDGVAVLARSGGLVGWVLAAPLLAIGSVWLAAPVIIVLLILSLFIITKTPPNRVGARLRELYAYLFGAQIEEPKQPVDEPLKFQPTSDLGLDDADPASMPWWRRNKTRREDDAAFDTPVVGRGHSTDIIDHTKTPDFGVELLEDLVKAEDAAHRFTGEIDTNAAHAHGQRADDPELREDPT